jgi:hypothetical protein
LASSLDCAGGNESRNADNNTGGTEWLDFTRQRLNCSNTALLNSSGIGLPVLPKFPNRGVATNIEAFVNADSGADFQIQIASICLGLTSADFIL